MATRAASIESTGSAVQELPTSQEIARLRSAGRAMAPQELKELTAKVKALEDMARLEDRLKALENRKRSAPPTEESTSSPNRQLEPQPFLEAESVEPTQLRVENSDTDSSSSSERTFRESGRSKRRKTNRGIKVTPSYTLRVNSSLREWGDWKRDIERVFEGDPWLYRRSTQKILKSLDYLDSNMKSLWYTHKEQYPGSGKWTEFVQWTRDNIQGGQNSTAYLYEQLDSARQLPEKSPNQFNAYLSAIERDLPLRDERSSAMTFYSKLSRDLKKQFKTADIPIPETRAKCVAVAQRVWEGLYGPEKRESRDSRPKEEPRRPVVKYSRPDSERGRIHGDHGRGEGEKGREPNLQVTCFKCGENGHYSTRCPKLMDKEKGERRLKVQSTLQEHSTTPESQTSSRSSSPNPEESDDSLN